MKAALRMVARRSFSAPSVLLTEQVTAGALTSATEPGNQWGGHQNRMVRTAAGVFCVYEISDGAGGKTWRLAWRWNGTWTTVATGANGVLSHGVPKLLADQATGRIYVVAWTSQRPRVFHGIPNVSNGTWTPTEDNTATLATYALGSEYLGAGITKAGDIVCQQGYGADGATETMDIWRRTSGGTWSRHNVASPVAGRYHYAHVLPDLTGNGCWIVATRSDNWAALGYVQPSSTTFPYVYDEVRAFRTADITAGTPSWSSVILRSQPQVTLSSAGEDPQALATSSGSIVDRDGRLHTLIQYTSNQNTVAKKVRHVVTSPALSILDQSDVTGLDIGYCRFLQNSAGSLFLLGQPYNTSTSTLWPIPNRALSTLGTAWTGINLGATVGDSGIHEAARHCGSQAGDRTDIGFNVQGNEALYRYALLQLPTG